MAKLRKRYVKKTLYRMLTDEQKGSHWYVDLPDDRPTFGRRVSAEEWIPLVNSWIETRPDGMKVVGGPSLFDEVIVVGTPEWKAWLQDLAMRMMRRLFWEPLESVGLTEEGVRRYGGCGDDLLPDAVRRARRAAQVARRKDLKAAREARRLAPSPSLFD
jgi:hypothetical protein